MNRDPIAASMTCPKCRTPLQSVRMAHGVFWRCENCAGRALGINLLRRTFVRDAINSVWRRAIKSEGQISRACPSCLNAMIEVAATNQPEPRVDVCRLCHFVWFDAEEISHFAPLPDAKPPKLRQNAREVLALVKVKRMASEPTDPWWRQIAEFFALPVDF